MDLYTRAGVFNVYIYCRNFVKKFNMVHIQRVLREWITIVDGNFAGSNNEFLETPLICLFSFFLLSPKILSLNQFFPVFPRWHQFFWKVMHLYFVFLLILITKILIHARVLCADTFFCLTRPICIWFWCVFRNLVYHVCVIYIITTMG